ncbi:Hypothetical protein D9617_1g082980 [Elsinoe fawcettii]|nr:Hypothetical protein D9617_1g082980 [Elsinoe fawcettii]
MRKLNFAGGEPFLAAPFLGELVDFAKQVLRLESVSIVSHGSLITEKWMAEHAHNLDILAVSCDSFNEDTNIAIGRGSGNQVTKLYQIKEWCAKYGVKFKVNTVVCALNKDEDMNYHIQQLAPFGWKCFQVLMVKGENDGDDTLRNVGRFRITDQEYDNFCKRHKKQHCFVPESDKLMAKSYLILDVNLRFLDRDGRKKRLYSRHPFTTSTIGSVALNKAHLSQTSIRDIPMKMPKPLRKLLEVEQKFSSLSPLFTTYAGSPPFVSLRRLPDQRFTDTYLDSRGHLMNKGIYIRRRNGRYEAKLSLGGTFTRFKFEEIKGKTDIQKMLNEHFGSRFKVRELVNEDFLVVMDKTCFGHEVGEIEHIGDLITSSMSGADTAVKDPANDSANDKSSESSASNLAIFLDEKLTSLVSFILSSFANDKMTALPNTIVSSHPTSATGNNHNHKSAVEPTDNTTTVDKHKPSNDEIDQLTKTSTSHSDTSRGIDRTTKQSSKEKTYPHEEASTYLTNEERYTLDDAQKKLDASMVRYAWAFSPDKPEGKLSAYFERYGPSEGMVRNDAAPILSAGDEGPQFQREDEVAKGEKIEAREWEKKLAGKTKSEVGGG